MPVLSEQGIQERKAQDLQERLMSEHCPHQYCQRLGDEVYCYCDLTDRPCDGNYEFPIRCSIFRINYGAQD